jgi:hypothetical protein
MVWICSRRSSRSVTASIACISGVEGQVGVLTVGTWTVCSTHPPPPKPIVLSC